MSFSRVLFLALSLEGLHFGCELLSEDDLLLLKRRHSDIFGGLESGCELSTAYEQDRLLLWKDTYRNILLQHVYKHLGYLFPLMTELKLHLDVFVG